MTSPYPPYQQPRKLERSRTNKVLGGVCGGVANYVNMDPTLVRVLTVVISLFTGVPVILYLIALFVIPEEGSNKDQQNYPPVNGPQQWSYGPYGQGTPGFEDSTTGQPSYAPGPGQQPAPGYGTGNPEDRAVWGAEGAPWEAGAQTPPANQPESGPASGPGQASTWESTPADPDADPNTGDQKR
jgi:phage shock protein PspC (stress-responsive transcriptional regulator)